MNERMRVVSVEYQSKPPEFFNLKKGKVYRCVFSGGYSTVREYLQAKGKREAMQKARLICEDYNHRTFHPLDRPRQPLMLEPSV